jgi:short-subunit dehydrogenase
MALAERNGRLALAARRSEELDETARMVESRGGMALVVPTDVTDDDQVRALVDKVIAEWGRIDIVVANAGQYIRGPAVDVTMDDLEQSIDINFFGTARVVLASLPHMIEQGSGHIALMASIDGKKGLPLDAPYAASKFAMVGFGDVLRQELRPQGVEVSTILFGRVDTPFVDGMAFPVIGKAMPVDRAARATVKAIERNRAEVILPHRAKPLVWIANLSPRLTDLALRYLNLEGWMVEEEET